MERELKEFAKKCSRCGCYGHNSRTCNGKGCFTLFGVKIKLPEHDQDHESFRKKSNVDESIIRKSKSMGNLQACRAEHTPVDAGYLSDGIIHESAKAHERKKGVPWTEDEHRSFLIGLEKLGKGDWKGISKSFVPSRTPTQVASHAQKYFIRMTVNEKKKRRSSLFDIPFKESSPPPQPSPTSNEASEFPLQASTSTVAPLKNSSNMQVQASTSSPFATFEKPPISPMARSYVPHFNHVPYMVGVSSIGHSLPPPKVVPVVSFLPMMNFPTQNYFYLPNSLLSQPNPHGPSQAGSANFSD